MTHEQIQLFSLYASQRLELESEGRTYERVSTTAIAIGAAFAPKGKDVLRDLRRSLNLDGDDAGMGRRASALDGFDGLVSSGLVKVEGSDGSRRPRGSPRRQNQRIPRGT